MKKSLKCFAGVMLAVGLSMPIFGQIASAEAAQDEIKVLLNSSLLTSDAAPIIDEGEILVPLRSIGEGLDARVDWEEKTQTAILKTSGWRGETELKLSLNSDFAQINGEKKALPVPVQVIDGRTLAAAEIIAESLDLALEWDEAGQVISLQERYRSQYGDVEVVLTPIMPDNDKSKLIYHGMQVEINGAKYEYDWDWNAGVWQYIVYAPPEIYWADLNGDGKEEIIIRLVDGINAGTGVSFEKVHVLEQNGTEIAAQDAGEYALSLAEEQEQTFAGHWVSYEIIDGELTAEVTVYENGEQKVWQMKYVFADDQLQVAEAVSVKY